MGCPTALLILWLQAGHESGGPWQEMGEGTRRGAFLRWQLLSGTYFDNPLSLSLSFREGARERPSFAENGISLCPDFL